jgi:DNA mismatch repair protein MSH2
MFKFSTALLFYEFLTLECENPSAFGGLTDDVLCMPQDTPVVMAVHVVLCENERCVGLAFVDMTKRQLGMTEFLDDDQFTSLESAMVALGCRECVIPQSTVAKSPDDRKLRDVMARCNVLVTEKKKTDFRY